ncbi:C4-dicarboxylate-binding periplasmic protein precursor [Pirellulimonas nuda]|uniref:C4-dicarboxylate-binding periplasmic protein n=1 Tax=Pirellulimonas nuda TaxID=2528009 RepID=A0A518DG86_9BACT|nr:TRAP transporter substrate-binding protein [Pirellulimonas nuda]QDU90442.1 C4-dicarboxylate-binding periplasmic protein precursor [Pirellulimonas nuda]
MTGIVRLRTKKVIVGKSTSFLLLGLLAVTLAATAVAALGLGQGVHSGPLVLKLGHSLDQSHPVHVAMEHMAQRLAEKSGGTMLLEIAPNGQLGSETDCIEYLQRGALALAKTSTSPLESFVPSMAVFGVPYAFRDEDHFWKVIEGEIGEELLAAGADHGVHGLCYYDAGARSFYTVNRPILAPDDLKGLKIRVQESKTSIAMLKALGGSPTPMSFGELYSALQQRIVDGAENNPPSFTSTRHCEVCKDYSLDEHSRTPDILLVSELWWDRLNADQKRWLTEAADESTTVQRRLWREETNKALRTAESEGVRIHRPDKSAFIEKVAEMHEAYGDSEIGVLLRRIEEVR